MSDPRRLCPGDVTMFSDSSYFYEIGAGVYIALIPYEDPVLTVNVSLFQDAGPFMRATERLAFRPAQR